MKPSEHSQMLSNEMPMVVEDIAKAPFETGDRDAEIALAEEEFDDYMKKLCATEDDSERIVDCLCEAKNDAFHVGKYKLMSMLGDEIEKRETPEEEEEDTEEEVMA
jgi:hypothetical protein